jgi:putative ABC transport system permease protein
MKMSLVKQFLIESLLISFISLIVCMIISWFLLPYFNQLAGKEIPHTVLFQPSILLSLLALMLIVGLLAGSYPAFFLSAFQPIEVLKGKLAGGFKRSWLRSSLVVVQFVISIVLIFGTVVIYSQLNYIHHKDLGFNRNQVITIYNTEALGEGITPFKNELLQVNGVQSATVTGFLPVNYYRSNNTFFTTPTLDPTSGISMQNWRVDENYIPTLDITMLQGRNFSRDFLTDSSAMVVNEAAAKFLDGKDLLNKKLYTIEDVQKKRVLEYHIIGIIKNFHFSSLRDVVTPLSFILGKDRSSISARIRTTDVPAVLAQIKNKWKSMAASQPFEYSFMDDDFNKLYTTEQRTGQIFVSFAVLAILIACLGLFGLITYAAEQRVKEIGIRKVLGADVVGIVSLISKDFLLLIGVASLFAFPLAWWAMHKWLQDFAYRVDISWQAFAFAGIITLVIALITISFQAIKAATANPVTSLRSE